MSLTPVEIAMCMDALLAAGVPQRIADEFIDLRGLRDRVHEFGCRRTIHDVDADAEVGLIDSIRRSMHYDLAKAFVDRGVARTRERRINLQTEITLSLQVLAPHGWTPTQAACRTEPIGSPPPAKVQR